MARLGRLLALVVLLAAWGLGWAKGSFVGGVSGSRAFIAVVVAPDNKVMAYVCDGAEVAEWFVGLLGKDGSLEISGAGRSLKLKVGEAGVSGTLALGGGEARAFTAPAATGAAGLYRYVSMVGNDRLVGGWILDQKGEQRGSVIGGGNLRTSSRLTANLTSDFAAFADQKPVLVTPEWVATNVN